MVVLSRAEPNIFFLNSCRAGARIEYQVMRLRGDGIADPPAPVIHSGNWGPGGVRHVAWVSAFRLGNRVRVYASRYLNNRWNDVAAWESFDNGRTVEFVGVILKPAPGELHGIGPAQVYHDPSSGRPWKMIYLVRGDQVSNVGTVFKLTTSADGLSWRAKGAVLRTSETYEAFGISPSYVTRRSNGEWVLFYQAYETERLACPVVAAASRAEGPFRNKRIIMQPDGVRHLSVTGSRSLRYLTGVAASVSIGVPHVLRRNDKTAMEVVVPVAQSGRVVHLERPLREEYAPGELVPITTAKIDPSYAHERVDGRWDGIFTGYGLFTDILTEYTFRVHARSLHGPWMPQPDGLAFKPVFPGSLLSLENPTPIIDVRE
jgi:hypothetical protein